MISLIPLCTAQVDVAPPLNLGSTPTGQRSVSDIRSVNMSGERIRATLAGAAAADWMVLTSGLGTIDVRMTLRTHDDALILAQYSGRLDLSNPKAGLYAYVAPLFETGDERYAWLTRIQVVGKGLVTPGASGAHIDYEFYELR
jgi:hypothetical protein